MQNEILPFDNGKNKKQDETKTYLSEAEITVIKQEINKNPNLLSVEKVTTDLEMQIFKFHENTINTFTIDGNPYFVAKNVCDVLEIQDTSNAVKDFDATEKLIRTIYVSGQNRNILFVSESGLYRLIFQSRKPEAKAFQKWVTSEVLPTIRKTGQYGKQLSIEQQTLNVLTHFRTRVTELENKIESDKPKVEFFNSVADSSDCIDFASFAKTTSIGVINLFRFLREKEIVFLHNGYNLPRQNYEDSGYFRVVEQTYKQKGETKLGFKTLITPKGQIWLLKFINRELKKKETVKG